VPGPLAEAELKSERAARSDLDLLGWCDVQEVAEGANPVLTNFEDVSQSDCLSGKSLAPGTVRFEHDQAALRFDPYHQIQGSLTRAVSEQYFRSRRCSAFGLLSGRRPVRCKLVIADRAREEVLRSSISQPLDKDGRLNVFTAVNVCGVDAGYRQVISQKLPGGVVADTRQKARTLPKPREVCCDISGRATSAPTDHVGGRHDIKDKVANAQHRHRTGSVRRLSSMFRVWSRKHRHEPQFIS
jgi:hypothetical protein